VSRLDGSMVHGARLRASTARTFSPTVSHNRTTVGTAAHYVDRILRGETTGFHMAIRQRDLLRGLAGRGPRAAAGGAGGRVRQPRFIELPKRRRIA
jgi:hypothetical protein